MPVLELVGAALSLGAWTAVLWGALSNPAEHEIVVEDGRISAIGEAIARPTNARLLDAEGSLVLPGLIDSHAHFVWPGPMP